MILLPACEAGNKIPDTSSSDIVDSETTSEIEEINNSPVVGCAWPLGSWIFTDCLGSQIQLDFHAAAQCTFQVVSASTVFAGAWAKVSDAGMSIFLPISNGSCHGAFDGESIMGACDTLTGPCSFVALPKLEAEKQ